MASKIHCIKCNYKFAEQRGTCPRCQTNNSIAPTAAARKVQAQKANYGRVTTGKIAPLPEAEAFTKGQLNELHHVFDAYDYDGSGTVDVLEFGHMWRALGGNPSEQEIQNRVRSCMVEQHYGDEASCFTFEDFVTFCKPFFQHNHKRGSLVDQLMLTNVTNALAALDADGNGVVNLKELEKAVSQDGLAGRKGVDPLPADDIKEIIAILKSKKLKNLTPTELARLLLG